MDVESESEKEKELILGGGELVGRSGGWLYIPLCTLLRLLHPFYVVFFKFCLSRFKLDGGGGE